MVDQKETDYIVHHPLQTPYSEDLIAMLKDVTKRSENALKAFFSSNIFLSFFTANLLQYLWGMINAM